MKKLGIIILLLSMFLGCDKFKEIIDNPQIMPNIYVKEANSRITYFEVHKIYEAWEYSKGNDVKIGIIDHSFDVENNPELYSGNMKFDSEKDYEKQIFKAGNGFWMASTLKEIAPNVEIYGLDIAYANKTEDEIFAAMIQAIEWAEDNNIKILTYSAWRMSEEHRSKLDIIINEASEKGVIFIFLHNPNKNNFLVSNIDPPIEGINNAPIVNVYDKDYSVILGSLIDKKGNVDTDLAYKSVSSKAPVLAGIIAMMLEINPTLTNDEIREIIIETSYVFENYDTRIENAVNATSAIMECIKIKKEKMKNPDLTPLDGLEVGLKAHNTG